MSEYVVDEAKNLLPFVVPVVSSPLYTFIQGGGWATFRIFGFSEDFQIGDVFRVSLVETVFVSNFEDYDTFQIWVYNIMNYDLMVSAPNFSIVVSNPSEDDCLFVSDFEPNWSASMSKGQNINKILNASNKPSNLGIGLCSVSLTFTRIA